MSKWMIMLAAVTDTSTNLFQEEWTTGNLYQIQPIVNVLSTVAVWVISVVGFGIVIFSILKNALSGLYVVNPNFWDKVSDVKNQAVAGATSAVQSAAGAVPGRGNAVAQRLGGVVTFILTLIPDVKALTDFDEQDGVPDKKQYFMKSLPLLVAQIFIGTFIFMGYPSKVANWIGTGGTYLIDAIINNTDPVAVIQGVSDSIMVYSLSTDGSPEPFDQTINKCAAETLRTVQSKYRDMQKDPTQETAYAIESFLMNALSQGSANTVLGAEEGYDIAVSVSFSNGVPQVSEAFKNVATNPSYPLVRAQSSNGIVQYKTWVSGQALPTGSVQVGDADYFVCTVTATPVAISKTSSASMIICAGYNGTPTVTTGNNVSVGITGITIGNGANDLHGTAGQSLSIDLMKVDGTGATVLASTSAKLMTASTGITENAIPNLVFDANQWANIKDQWNSATYVRITLSGSWSMDVQKAGTGGKNSISTSVSELRLTNGGSVSYAVNIWSDFSLADYAGVTDAYQALTQQSKTPVTP